MKKLTLYEAMSSVLKEFDRPMTARELADQINKNKLYTKGDGSPLDTSQINARASNKKDLFCKDKSTKPQKIHLCKE